MIILPIENIKQEREEWCWLAVVEQVITWHNGQSLEQPKLSRLVGNGGGGRLEDMAFLIKKQTDLKTQKMRGNNIEIVETFIKDRTPVILEVSVEEFQHHALLLKGLIEDKKSGERLFLINDPLRTNGYSFAVKPEILLTNLQASLAIFTK